MIAVNRGLAGHRHAREAGRTSLAMLRIDDARITDGLREPIAMTVPTPGSAP